MTPKLYRHRKPGERLSHQVGLLLNDEDYSALTYIAGARGICRTEAIRVALREVSFRLRSERATRDKYNDLIPKRA